MKKTLILLFIPIFVIFSFAVFFLKIQRGNILATSPDAPIQKTVHSSNLYDPEFFTQAYGKNELYKKPAHSHISGGIIPHHLLAAPLIAGFFEGIASQKVKTVVLISPNHHGAGTGNIQASEGYWSTIYGDLVTHDQKIETLKKDGAVSIQEDSFDTEHGIYGLTPFIKKTFPESKIIPIIITGSASRAECDILVGSLKKILDEDTLILVSSDFSHYVPSAQADTFDKQTIQTIRSFDNRKILELDHEKNTDSPESLYVLLELMKIKRATHTILLANTNSAKLTGQPDLQSTTSYATMYFTDQENLLTHQHIFKYYDPDESAKKITKEDEYTLIATGDVLTARSVNAKLVELGDFNYPYEKTITFLKNADTVLINLETPLVPGCKSTLVGMIFCGDIRNTDGLKYMNTAVANIANNHMGNYGEDGVKSTVSILEKNNIQVTGNGKPSILFIKNKKIGFLGYNHIGHEEPGVDWADPEKITEDVSELKKNVDFVVVSFHWGDEYTSSPNAAQIELAYTAIDAGAELIIGNHPHWVQGVEIYKDKFISYAHGNFVFDQMWSRATRGGVLGKYTFSQKGLKSVQFFPIIIDDNLQTRFADEKEADVILSRMSKYSVIDDE